MKNVKPPVKRLKSKTPGPLEENDNLERNLVTQKTIGERDLPDLAPKRLFLLKPQVKRSRFCYVTCRRVVLDYSVSYFNANRTNDGQITFIVDDKKGVGAIEDNIKIRLVKKNIDKTMVEEEVYDDEQAQKKAIVDARWKVLLSRYKKPPELEVRSIDKFYRPYYDVIYTFGGNEKQTWIPADEYGTYVVYN